MFAMPKYKERISLIPGGCPQLLDFAVDLNSLPRIRRSFEEQRCESTPEGHQVQLHALEENDEGQLVDVLDRARTASGSEYELDARKTLLPWLQRWIPVPFLREREQLWEDGRECRVEYGPTNWARVRFVMSDDAAETLRIVLAFDMQVEERNDAAYCALCPQDVNAHAQFRLAWRYRDNSWFLNEAWVDSWLREIWTEWQKTNRRRMEDGPELEHLASYLTILELLHHCIGGTKVYVINPYHHNPIDVDLVLDIGNSRTTGILVETRAQSATNLNDSYLLQLRDMDRPEHVYTDPFETRVEFSEISFGNDALSRRSGRRSPAFVWPSPVRIGPEAAHLSTLSICAEGTTGMSSPKRYLWDERNWAQSWRFNTKGFGEPYVTRGLLAQQVNSSGTPLCCMQDKLFTRNKILRKQETDSAFESLFTRSSLMMFLLVEVIQQALLTINSPGQRGRRDASDVPRRLRQVIFTVPAGMPIAEQRIYRRWAKWAVHVLWEALGWSQYYVEKPAPQRKEGPADYRTSPQVRCNWDEATCTQLVYIYNEITRKFQGDAHLFCSLSGRPRQEYGNLPCVRVATIDIGGGTTDLSITTFKLQSDAGSTARMVPYPEFHDGFNLAGDDVLCAVVREHVLPALGEAMARAGIKDTRAALAHLFGRDVMDRSQESRNLRIQFIRQVAVPVALCILAIYEQADLRTGTGSMSCSFRDCFRFPMAASPISAQESASSPADNGTPTVLPCPLHPAPNQGALNYVEEYVRTATGDDGFTLLDVPLRIDPRRVDDTVRTVLKDVLANLCEVIHLYDCDALLLTGRPSRWQGIVDSVYALLPVPPDRILPMGNYRVGGWYPFADALGRMTDPKTTVVVGAILCTLAEGQLEGFSFDPYNLTLTSTARFIGEMELNGQIKKPKVWFEVDVQNTQESTYTRTITFGGPIAVGFRQLDVERWTTTRFYFLEFVNEDVRRTYASRLPFSVTLKLTVSELEERDVSQPMSGTDATERDEGEFVIEEVLDCQGNPVSNALEIRLQTLPRDEGFWLDTGIVYA